MSKYTTELRWIIENGYDLQMNEYPIFNEQYRETLNSKIINHFYFREIGFETVALFRWYLKSTMNEIMPYYNKLYESESLKIDPLQSVNYVETLSRQRTSNDTRDEKEDSTNVVTGDSNASTKNDTSNKVVESDTPQGMLSIGSIENETYATNAQLGKGSENGTSTAHQQTSDDGSRTRNETIKHEDSENYTRNESGFRESQSDLLRKYRETFLNIDMMIINELNDLFMGLY